MNILLIISPLVVIAALGFLCAKSQWLAKAQIEALSKFTFSLCIPAFLFYQMATANFGTAISAEYFAAFYLPVLLCYAIAWLINHYLNPNYQHQAQASAVYALGSSYSNTVIVGLPILLMIYDERVLVLIFLIVTFHSAMLFALTGLFAAGKHGFNWREFFNNTIKNPLIISVFLGMAVNFSTMDLPAVLSESLPLLAKPAITLALFVLGASLAFYQVRSLYLVFFWL